MEKKMSRSYMKNMGGTWACGSDKYSRSMYQRSFRRTVNRYCNQLKNCYDIEQIFKIHEELPTDRIVNGIDYSCRFADKWTWASDGGTYIRETESSLKIKFEEEIFGIAFNWRKKSKDIWTRYNDAFSNEYLWPDYFLELIVKKNLPKKRFETKEDLILWLRENQKWLISVWKKINYGK